MHRNEIFMLISFCVNKVFFLPLKKTCGLSLFVPEEKQRIIKINLVNTKKNDFPIFSKYMIRKKNIITCSWYVMCNLKKILEKLLNKNLLKQLPEMTIICLLPLISVLKRFYIGLLILILKEKKLNEITWLEFFPLSPVFPLSPFLHFLYVMT